MVLCHPKILIYDVILALKWPNFDHFHQKWQILTKLTPLMSLSTKVMLINLSQIIYPGLYSKYFLTNFQKCWPMTSYWPKIPNFNNFHQKAVIFGENGQNWDILEAKMTAELKILWWEENFFLLNCLNNYFCQIYLHKCC